MDCVPFELGKAVMAENDNRGHFIPLRKRELVEVLASEGGLNEVEKGQWQELCKLIDASIHFHFHQRLEQLREAYAPYDPDAEERPLKTGTISAEQDQKEADHVFAEFDALMTRANFRRLTREEIVQAISSASHLGIKLKTDFKVFEKLEVYARGYRVAVKKKKNLAKGLRTDELAIPTYERLAVILRMKPEADAAATSVVGRSDVELEPIASSQRRPIVMKLFKNIPQGDVEMLLPGTRVEMSLYDQGRILLPTISGLGMTAYKLFQGAVAVAFASLYGLFAFLGLVGGAIGYGVSAFFGYSNTKNRYHLNLTRSLYFQSLDNNAGVIMRLLDEAEAQEFREAVLAYWLLWRQGNDDGGWHAKQIDLAAEEFLKQRCGVLVNFEIEDAIDKLCQANLVQQQEDGKYRVLGMQAAMHELDRQWDGAFTSSAEHANEPFAASTAKTAEGDSDLPQTLRFSLAEPEQQSEPDAISSTVAGRRNILKILQAA